MDIIGQREREKETNALNRTFSQVKRHIGIL
jgi:hypothetical protein